MSVVIDPEDLRHMMPPPETMRTATALKTKRSDIDRPGRTLRLQRLEVERFAGSFLRRREQQIRIVVTEIRQRRDRFHGYAIHFAVCIEAEGHVSRLDGLVVEARDEGVVLPML